MNLNNLKEKPFVAIDMLSEFQVLRSYSAPKYAKAFSVLLNAIDVISTGRSKR